MRVSERTAEPGTAGEGARACAREFTTVRMRMLPGATPLRAEWPGTRQAVACAVVTVLAPQACTPPSPAAPGSAAHSLTHAHLSVAFPLLQVLCLGTRSFLPLHSGMLLPVPVPGPPMSEVLGDILPHSTHTFYFRTPCAFIPGPPRLNKKSGMIT